MPKVAHDRLKAIGEALMIAHGVPAEEAEIVMRHSVEANLVGHDSHGIIQIPTYLERVKQGHIVPGAPWQIVQESATTTVIDGNWGFGYVVNEKAMKYTIEKAKKQNVAAATVFRQSHIGRLASYPLLAAAEGMEVAQCPEHRLLRNVLRQHRIAGQPARKSVHRIEMRKHQRAKSLERGRVRLRR